MPRQFSKAIFLILLVAVTDAGAPVVPESVSFYIAPSREVCLHEEFEEGRKVLLFFEVIRGGNFEIDFSVKDSNGQLVADVKEQKEYHVKFYPSQSGVYSMCFSNPNSAFQTKLVNLDISVEKTAQSDNMW
eukprot:CAMPEP_0196666166 /NCGR_PEP_ID=MMETSP1086-20130531/64097_1 /TAXON_ID=77921 /ORGANISM="Cyanoptyche  gloeocystis , Strain SAG4.97" /LENGTH=130 /DNA_ID=CAMNT_0042003271 /DNA_START=63 /DNA_END=452 /DNA_ORIENTATION=+